MCSESKIPNHETKLQKWEKHIRDVVGNRHDSGHKSKEPRRLVTAYRFAIGEKGSLVLEN